MIKYHKNIIFTINLTNRKCKIIKIKDKLNYLFCIISNWDNIVTLNSFGSENKEIKIWYCDSPSASGLSFFILP